MSFPFGRNEHYSPLGVDSNVIYSSPAPIQQQWNNTYDGDLSSPPINSPEIEMQGRPNYRQSSNSFQSINSRSSFLPSPNTPSTAATESQAFLYDPLSKSNSRFSTSSYQPYKDNTGKQLWHLLVKSSARWLVTAGLCAGYILSTRIWVRKTASSENDKKMYNAITTAISIALGLNIASAFKDMALNMRWPILSARKRNLKELDLILHADSLTELFKLVFVARRFWVIVACIFWLLINILAQAGIAMLSLTYGFDVNYNAVLHIPGNVSIPDMTHFFPQGNYTDPSDQDEKYTAHLYGGLDEYGYGDRTYAPKPNDIYKTSNPMLWYDNTTNYIEFTFSDSPAQSSTNGGQGSVFSAYSARKINITYVCEAHEVLEHGNGAFNNITVAEIGIVSVDSVVPNSVTYFTNLGNVCEPGNFRCSIVEAFEASDTNPYYYKCNVTLGLTQNDPRNLSFISDAMAYKATGAIAQPGYIDAWGQEYQIYPNKSAWGTPSQGDQNVIGFKMAAFALGSIAGASLFNPYTYYEGMAPTQAFSLNLNHPFFFYLIIGLICACQLFFCLIVAVLANRVMVGPDEHLAMSLLLRPIADSLEAVSGGRQNKAYKDAKKSTTIRYEKAMNGRWILNII